MAAVVAPVLQLYFEAEDDVSDTVVPGQTLVVMAGTPVIVGVTTVA